MAYLRLDPVLLRRNCWMSIRHCQAYCFFVSCTVCGSETFKPMSKLLITMMLHRSLYRARRPAAPQGHACSRAHGQLLHTACTLGSAWPGPQPRQAAPALQLPL